MEKWDVYDKDRNPLGRTHVRGVPRPEGDFHVIVGIWVVNSLRQVLLTLRCESKKQSPLKWENTGGSVLAGETSLHAAMRELKEETGIVVTEEEFTLLGNYVGENLFIDVYILQKDVALADIVLQPGETIDAKWVSIEQLEQMCADGSIAKPIATRFMQFKETFMAFVNQIS